MPETGFKWNDDRVSDLRRLFIDDRRSYTDCAAELVRRHGGRLSRSSIAGKVKRLGIQRGEARVGRAPKPPRPPRPPHVAAPCRDLRERTRVTAQGRVMRVFDRAPPVPPPAPIEPRRVAFLALEHGDCRWPLGDPRAPDFVCCGLPRVTVELFGKAEPDPRCFYCAYHRKLGRN